MLRRFCVIKCAYWSLFSQSWPMWKSSWWITAARRCCGRAPSRPVWPWWMSCGSRHPSSMARYSTGTIPNSCQYFTDLPAPAPAPPPYTEFALKIPFFPFRNKSAQKRNILASQLLSAHVFFLLLVIFFFAKLVGVRCALLCATVSLNRPEIFFFLSINVGDLPIFFLRFFFLFFFCRLLFDDRSPNVFFCSTLEVYEYILYLFVSFYCARLPLDVLFYRNGPLYVLFVVETTIGHCSHVRVVSEHFAPILSLFLSVRRNLLTFFSTATDSCTYYWSLQPR